MIEIEEVPPLRSPVMIAAFEGWNDAADAASGVVDHLLDVWDSRLVAVMDPEDFYDFQVNRPTVGPDELGQRRITWPSTQISVASPPGSERDVILIRGIEPNMRWRQFCAELLAAADDLGGQIGVTPRAPPGHPPHTRRAAGRHPAHPAGAGHGHGDRAGAHRPAQARAVDVRRTHRHRRRLPGRVR